MTASIAAHGRAGRDGERIETKSGTPMAKVSVAVDVERSQNAADRPPAMWISVLGFNSTADAVAAVEKGDLVHVIGKLQRQRWTDREGAERESWECVADAILSHRPRQRQNDGQQAPPSEETWPTDADVAELTNFGD